MVAAETSTSGLVTSESGFYVLTGGVVSSTDYYNVLKVMINESQVWMWWNNILLPPATGGNPYYTITDEIRYGKFGLRLWPGAKVRRMILRSKLHQFSEFSLGQLELS